MKIKLIDVGHPMPGRSWTNWVDGGKFAMPSSGLVSVASLSREHDEVEIVDEKVEGPVDPETLEADVVGLSFKTMYSARAYALADCLRARGKKVVLGGVHATNVPEEAAQHADVVCVGEGETAVAADPRRPRGGHREADVHRADVSARAALDAPLAAVRAAEERSLPRARGPERARVLVRLRVLPDAADVRLDLPPAEHRLARATRCEHLLQLDDKPVFFTENVFGAGDMNYVDELAGRLNGIGASYGCIVDWVMVKPELMQLLATNGCQLVCINLTGRRTKEELAAVKAISDAGMAIWGYIMFGFEEDTPDVFQGAIDTVNEYGIVCSTAHRALRPTRAPRWASASIARTGSPRAT